MASLSDKHFLIRFNLFGILGFWNFGILYILGMISIEIIMDTVDFLITHFASNNDKVSE